MVVKNPFLRKANTEKMLRYATVKKNWMENLWQQVAWIVYNHV